MARPGLSSISLRDNTRVYRDRRKQGPSHREPLLTAVDILSSSLSRGSPDREISQRATTPLFFSLWRPTEVRKLKLNLDSGNSTGRLTGRRRTIRSELERRDCGLISGHCSANSSSHGITAVRGGEDRNGDKVSREGQTSYFYFYFYFYFC